MGTGFFQLSTQFLINLGECQLFDGFVESIHVRCMGIDLNPVIKLRNKGKKLYLSVTFI